MAYSAYVSKLQNVRKDEKSDNLYTATVMGEGVIVGASSHEGQRVLYLPADGQLSYDFAMRFGLLRKDKNGQPAGGYLDENRHIKAINMRGLRSEGIAIPLDRVEQAYGLYGFDWGDGNPEVQQIPGSGEKFCWKYIPRGGGGRRGASTPKTSYRGRKAEGVVYPEFAMHSDTGQLAYNESAFYVGDLVSMSLKLHGTSQRSMKTYAEHPRGFFRRLFGLRAKRTPEYVLGTRRVVVTRNKTGFYGDESFRIKHHNDLQPYIAEGMEVFYEVVGWVSENSTIMPTCDNRKLKNKGFVKEFGETTAFTYGCKPGESKIFVYRIVHDGEEYTPDQISEWCYCANSGANRTICNPAPEFDAFFFTTWEDLCQRVNRYFDNLRDPIGKDHIKEGVIVRILARDGRNLPFRAFKSKTYEFKVLEGIIKETADAPDMEEAQDA